MLAGWIALPAYAQASPAEDAMVGAINEARQSRGLPGLRESPLLSRSAASYSRYMIARDFFGHLSAVRMSTRFSLRGEILAWHSGANPRVRPTLRSWLASPAHRTVILHSRMRYVGAGLARGQFGGRTSSVWTVHFGAL